MFTALLTFWLAPPIIILILGLKYPAYITKGEGKYAAYASIIPVANWLLFIILTGDLIKRILKC